MFLCDTYILHNYYIHQGNIIGYDSFLPIKVSERSDTPSASLRGGCGRQEECQRCDMTHGVGSTMGKVVFVDHAGRLNKGRERLRRPTQSSFPSSVP